MTIIERIEKRTSALKAGEAAELLEVTPQHIYSLASRGLIPSLRIEGAWILKKSRLTADAAGIK